MNTEAHAALQRQWTESLENWLARHPLLAPLHGMHTRQKEQVQLSDEAMTQLILAADHANPKVRWWCAHELDHLADERSVATLLRLTKDEIPKVRAEAVHALGCERCKQCVLPVDVVGLMIEAALSDPADRVREAAIFALGYLPSDHRIAAALEQLANDSSLTVNLRTEARRTLKYHQQR
jgi:HEAT repeat protein